MIIDRIISDVGVGLLSYGLLLRNANLRTIAPVYHSEISPPHQNRGKLACIEFIGNIVGYASICLG